MVEVNVHRKILNENSAGIVDLIPLGGSIVIWWTDGVNRTYIRRSYDVQDVIETLTDVLISLRVRRAIPLGYAILPLRNPVASHFSKVNKINKKILVNGFLVKKTLRVIYPSIKRHYKEKLSTICNILNRATPQMFTRNCLNHSERSLNKGSWIDQTWSVTVRTWSFDYSFPIMTSLFFPNGMPLCKECTNAFLRVVQFQIAHHHVFS